MNQLLPKGESSPIFLFSSLNNQISLSILGLVLLPALAQAGEAEGIVWLKNQAGFSSKLADPLQTTQELSKTLSLLSQPFTGTSNLDGLLQDEHSTELLARAAIIAKLQQQSPSIYLTELKAAQNDDGGFGHLEGWQSNPLDTAFVLIALARQ